MCPYRHVNFYRDFHPSVSTMKPSESNGHFTPACANSPYIIIGCISSQSFPNPEPRNLENVLKDSCRGEAKARIPQLTQVILSDKCLQNHDVTHEPFKVYSDDRHRTTPQSAPRPAPQTWGALTFRPVRAFHTRLCTFLIKICGASAPRPSRNPKSEVRFPRLCTVPI